jgi:hypothetical protein
MSYAMTDWIYSSPVANMGGGNRQATLNKEVCEYPAPNRYEPRKNDRIVDPHVRQRKRITVKQPLEKEHQARRKKDRSDQEVNFLSQTYKQGFSQPIVQTNLQEMSPEQSTMEAANVQNVYTLGMAERDKLKESTGPGPGTHNFKSKIGEGPAYKIGAKEKDYKGDRDQTAGPSSFNIVLKSRAPKYSFGSRPGVGLGYGLMKQAKSMKPGPGAYENKDNQFKKP